MIRQPIVSILGHVDHGKTSLLDKIRSTAVAAKEAGGITQAIGATDVPLDAVKKVAGSLLQKFKIDVKIPGLLFIDTPGHEAFTSLRKRGGSIADLAVLVVDINEGFMPQTEESLELLKSFKTPFVVAANKIDMIDKWRSIDKPFLENYNNQTEEAKNNFDVKFYNLLATLSEKGFASERFDRIKDFRKEVAIIPCAGKVGEGVPDLLVMLTGLAQQFLTDKLELSQECKGAVLEIKELRGFGVTIDAILYDGSAKPGDYLVVGGTTPIVSKIKALLKPEPLKEIRVEKQFKSVPEAHAATGVKIAAPDLDKVKAGAPIRIAKDLSKAQQLLQELVKEKEEVEFESSVDGIILKADSLGSLEAMINIFKKHLPIRRAVLGAVDKKDVMEAKSSPDPFKRLIFAFNVPVNETDPDVTIINDNIIYRILERYEEFLESTKKKLEMAKLKDVTRPAKITIIPGFVFRANNPAIVGVEVNAGLLKPGCSLINNEGKIIGDVKNVQNQNETVQEAKPGSRVAVSIEGPTVGRQIREGDVLYSNISERDYRLLMELKDVISKSEFETLQEIVPMKRKIDINWGLY